MGWKTWSIWHRLISLDFKNQNISIELDQDVDGEESNEADDIVPTNGTAQAMQNQNQNHQQTDMEQTMPCLWNTNEFCLLKDNLRFT